jgi:hypothetical protein
MANNSHLTSFEATLPKSLHNANRIEMHGDSMRKKRGNLDC